MSNARTFGGNASSLDSIILKDEDSSSESDEGAIDWTANTYGKKKEEEEQEEENIPYWVSAVLNGYRRLSFQEKYFILSRIRDDFPFVSMVNISSSSLAFSRLPQDNATYNTTYQLLCQFANKQSVKESALKELGVECQNLIHKFIFLMERGTHMRRGIYYNSKVESCIISTTGEVLHEELPIGDWEVFNAEKLINNGISIENWQIAVKKQGEIVLKGFSGTWVSFLESSEFQNIEDE